MTFSEKIKELRKEKGVNQEIASKEMEMAISSLRNYENGRLPDTEQLKKIQNYYNVPYEYLLNDDCMTKKFDNINISKELGLSDNSINNLRIFKKIKEYNIKLNNNRTATIDLINNILENTELLGYFSSYLIINQYPENYEKISTDDFLNNFFDKILNKSDIDFSHKEYKGLNLNEVIKSGLLQLIKNELDKLSN